MQSGTHSTICLSAWSFDRQLRVHAIFTQICPFGPEYYANIGYTRKTISRETRLKDNVYEYLPDL
jgi:hypothetical protein